MQVVTTNTQPFDDQKPGTSGLRKKVSVFTQKHYLNNFVQSIFNAVNGIESLVLGGDGRYFNATAIQVIVRMAAANGVNKLIIGRNGLLSTPAVSALIRHHQTDGGIILSASHNPAGENGDFGIKFNTPNGAPAPQHITDAIYRHSLKMNQYRTIQCTDIDLSRLGTFSVADMMITIIDPVDHYAGLMASLFDFDAISAMFATGFRMRFDAMHAITGPYAKAIFENRLGAPSGTVINGLPLPDFGGGHPDPNLIHAKSLVAELFSDHGPAFGAASDGDGDRNLILGKHCFVTPSDSLAVIAAMHEHVPVFSGGIKGVARSMPTSQAVDVVAQARAMEYFETPTGWKFFCNLMDAGRVQLCGEESFGTGGDHVREKDGLWAVLCWLNILAKTRQPVQTLLQNHWRAFGRHYYSRHDYENIDAQIADSMMQSMLEALRGCVGQAIADDVIRQADEFTYVDPIDASRAEHQGLRLILDNARIIFRLSGTGTSGATLRVYLERFHRHDIAMETQQALSELIQFADTFAQIKHKSGRQVPDVIT